MGHSTIGQDLNNYIGVVEGHHQYRNIKRQQRNIGGWKPILGQLRRHVLHCDGHGIHGLKKGRGIHHPEAIRFQLFHRLCEEHLQPQIKGYHHHNKINTPK